MARGHSILCLNSGSSSLKFALYEMVALGAWLRIIAVGFGVYLIVGLEKWVRGFPGLWRAQTIPVDTR